MWRERPMSAATRIRLQHIAVGIGRPGTAVRRSAMCWKGRCYSSNRDDIPVRFTVVMLCAPGKPMLALVEEDEIAQRKHRRVPGRRDRKPTPARVSGRAAFGRGNGRSRQAEVSLGGEPVVQCAVVRIVPGDLLRS